MREYRREFSGPRVLAGLLLTCLGLGGCGNNPGTETNSAAVPAGDDGKIVDTSKDGITAYISTGDYLAWGKEPAIRDTVRAHGSKARTYFNRKYLMARRGDVYPMPIGAMAIKELYNGTTLYGYSVGVKNRSGSGAETWTWYETTGLPTVQYYGVANPICEGCHSADDGRDRSLAPYIP